MDELLVAQVLDDVDLGRNRPKPESPWPFDLEVLGAKADQQVPAAVLRRCFGRRAYKVELVPPSLSVPSSAFAVAKFIAGEPMKAATNTFTGLS